MDTLVPKGAQYDTASGRRKGPTLQTQLSATSVTSYHVRLSDQVEDAEWDSFLAQTAGGHHVQTSLWAQVKAVFGWRPVRLVVSRAEQIVAGAQLLIRPMAGAGALGYVTKGPVVAVDDPLLTDLVIDNLYQVAQSYHLQYLLVQPPNNGQPVAEALPSRGFRPSPISLGLAATVRIDLRQDREQLFAGMRRQTRRDIRHGLGQGMIGREGTEHDLAAFYRLLVATSERQKFVPYPLQYFARIWQLYHPHGYVRLFLVEYNGEVVSAQLAVPFGDTVITKQCGWSGRYGNLGPNHVMEWTTMEWANAQGYRYYDLEGIDPSVAGLILNGGSLTEELKRQHGPAYYKLGFGGKVMLLPGTYDYVYNPMLRWCYVTVFPRIASWPITKTVISRLRTS
jgi:lipid II:glycine glycyltransferase (peptidoglycan interpeptide bridge formation enzyme)